MSTQVLLLNASFEPLTMVRVTRATQLVLADKAEIVEYEDGRYLRSAERSIARPVVIRLKGYVRVPLSLRRGVTNTVLFARDGACCYCGRTERELRPRESFTRDHVLPQSRGGQNTWTNCVTSCNTCNGKKADRTPAEAGMPLLIDPVEPHFVELKWPVRRLTVLQQKWIARWFGEETLEALRPVRRRKTA